MSESELGSWCYQDTFVMRDWLYHVLSHAYAVRKDG